MEKNLDLLVNRINRVEKRAESLKIQNKLTKVIYNMNSKFGMTVPGSATSICWTGSATDAGKTMVIPQADIEKDFDILGQYDYSGNSVVGLN